VRRVAFVSDCLALGGTEKHLEELILRTDATQVQPVIICRGPDVYTSFLKKHGRSDVVVHQVCLRSFWDYLRVFVRLRLDVIVFVNGKLGLFPWWAYAAARLSGVERDVGIEHLQAEHPLDNVPPTGLVAWARGLIGWRARHMLARKLTGYLSHTTICVSDAVRRTLIRDYEYPQARTLTIHNGIDLNYYRRSGESKDAARTALGLRRDHQVLVYVARLAPVKRVDILLQALAIVSRSRAACKCMIVGGGSLEPTLKAEACRLGLSDTVLFAGHREDVRPYLEAADVYVTSAEREGFGLAVVEAMAFELPCVATKIGGHDEILAERGTGVLVAPCSPEELARGIESLLDHPAQAQAMGIAARKVVEERFNVDRMAAQIGDVLLLKASS
jgi:glycosyltransferase involved in cell wall biosynthesis